MERASYRKAVEWIAHNDEDGSGDGIDGISQYVTTLLVADIFCVEPRRVATDIARARRVAGIPVAE